MLSIEKPPPKKSWIFKKQDICIFWLQKAKQNRTYFSESGYLSGVK